MSTIPMVPFLPKGKGCRGLLRHPFVVIGYCYPRTSGEKAGGLRDLFRNPALKL